MKKYRVPLAFLLAGSIMIALGLMSNAANADISNPHPTPPSNSITHGMLQSGIIDDVNVDVAAALQLFKLGTSGDGNDIPFGGGSGLATSSKLTFNATTNTLIVNATTSLAATTTINGVNYYWPTTQGAINTVPVNNGSGSITWGSSGLSDKGSNNTGGLVVTAGNTATTTVLLATISPGTFTTQNIIGFWGVASSTTNNSDCYAAMQVGNGTATTTFYTHSLDPGEESAFSFELSPFGSGQLTWAIQATAYGPILTNEQGEVVTVNAATTSNIYIALTARISGSSTNRCGWVQAAIKLF